jgi:hypothetical protein
MFKRADDEFLRTCGLDAFFLCHYLLVLLKILVPAAMIILPILLPLNATGGNNIQKNAVEASGNATEGLDVLTLSNIQPGRYNRLWAHVVLATLLVVWTCYVMVMELQYFVNVRQTYLTSPQHRLRASSSTVLVEALPTKYMDRGVLTELFDVYPGGIRNIWVNRNYDSLNGLVKERNKCAKSLEAAESGLIQKCWRAHLNKRKQSKDDQDPHASVQVDGQEDFDHEVKIGGGVSANNPGQVHHTVDEAVGAINHSEMGDEIQNDGRANILGQGLKAIGRGIGHGIDRIGNLGKGRRTDSLGNEDPNTDETLRNGHMSRIRKAFTGGQRSSGNDNDGPADDVPPVESATGGTIDRRDVDDHETANSLAFDLYYDEDEHVDADWRKYIDLKDRPTMRVSQRWTWCPSLINPLASKVDTIYHCRKNLARLNKLIEERQLPDLESKYPPLASAFIQFNNQAAAHMACQSLAHQAPTSMTPRLIEIAPNDIIWDNMAIPGWQRYIRKGIVFTIASAVVIIWTPLIAASSASSQLNYLAQNHAFSWLQKWPPVVKYALQGILPVVLVAGLIVILGIILRLLVRYEGAPTNMQVERTVQRYFFAFSFIQYFLVVTVASALATVWNTLSSAIRGGTISVFEVPRILAQNIPIASNYFLSNILLQSLSQSASGLLQFISLLVFVVTNLTNSGARQKFSTRTSLNTVGWGTTYPQYTVLACIALIYSVIAPLILPLTILGFGIWWISTRYQMLYIYQYRQDTGGLLFPVAITQLFTGLYVLELFIIGFLGLALSADSNSAPKSIVPMIVFVAIVLSGTIMFHRIVKGAFQPILKYLPITLEDDAVKSDEEFRRLLATKHDKQDEVDMMGDAAEGGPVQADNEPIVEPDVEAQRATASATRANPTDHPPMADHEDQEKDIETRPSRSALQELDPRNIVARDGHRKSWAERGRRSPMHSRSTSHVQSSAQSLPGIARTLQEPSRPEEAPSQPPSLETESLDPVASHQSRKIFRRPAGAAGQALDWVAPALAAPLAFVAPNADATAAQHSAFDREAREIYGSIPDDLEDLTTAERDALLSRAFRHAALRAKRPCVWLPRDPLGVSDSEVACTARFSSWIWISNERQRLDGEGRCVYDGPPPDFDEVDLIQL